MPETRMFFVNGTPQSQGSARAFVVNGKPIITSTNKNLNLWRRLIADSAQSQAFMGQKNVAISATFFMPKPKSYPKKVVPMIKRPDIDKLIRALLDALTGIFYLDDSQVNRLEIFKTYAEPGEQTGVGVEVTIEV